MTQEKLPHRKELCLQSDTLLINNVSLPSNCFNTGIFVMPFHIITEPHNDTNMYTGKKTSFTLEEGIKFFSSLTFTTPNKNNKTATILKNIK